MKKLLKILLSVVLIFFIANMVLVILFEQSRKFYCVDKKCVTVWKRIGGTCYVINGKYYGLSKPANHSYLQTFNTVNLSLFFNQKMPKQIIVMDKEYSETYGKYFTIHNNSFDDKEFISYTDKYDKLLFPSRELKDIDVTPDTKLLNLIISEGYAKSNGVILR